MKVETERMSPIDSSITDLMDCFKRIIGGSPSSFSDEELELIDSDLNRAISSRLNHVFKKQLMEPDEIRNAFNQSAFKNAIKKRTNVFLEHGKIVDVTPVDPISVSRVSQEYRQIFPLLLSARRPKEFSLVGFEKAESQTVWFAQTQNTKKGFYCVGYTGKVKGVSYESLREKGYFPITDKGDSKKIFLSKIKDRPKKDDVSNVSVFIATHTLSGYDFDTSKEKLRSMLSMLPESPMKKPKINNAKPRF